MKAILNRIVNREYNIHYWGPLLFKIKIDSKDIKAIKKICGEAKEKFNHDLAGIIDKEVRINKSKYINIIKPYLKIYRESYKNWYHRDFTDINISEAWANYMKQGECNPPHHHTVCDLSSVVCLDIPKQIKKEQKEWKNTGAGPASLSFYTGNPQSFHNNSYSFRPEVGDFFVFPWNLTHSVSSYKSKATRVSVAANFNLTNTGAK